MARLCARGSALHLRAKSPAYLARNNINGRKRSCARRARVSLGKRSFTSTLTCVCAFREIANRGDVHRLRDESAWELMVNLSLDLRQERPAEYSYWKQTRRLPQIKTPVEERKGELSRFNKLSRSIIRRVGELRTHRI